MTATMQRPDSSLNCLPRFTTERDYSRRTFGPLVGAIAKSLGKPLMPWQQYVVDIALEVDDDGMLIYSEVVLTVPRQSGKTTLLLPLFVHRSIAEYPGGNLETGPQPQSVAYTAQTRNDARKKWIKEFVPTLERSALRHKFEKRLTNGSEGLDWSNGSSFNLMATMEKSGHGDTLDLGIIDEAFAQQDDRLEQSMEPATSTRRCPQIWIVSTAGENEIKSPFLWSKVKAGRAMVEAGEQSSTAYFEWSLADDEDPDDIDVVAARHPAVGYTITRDRLAQYHAKAKRKGEMAGFRRAYCNRWGTVDVAADAKIDADKWKANVVRATDAPSPEIGGFPIAFEVSQGGDDASIVMATGRSSSAYVEVMDHRNRTDWLADRLVEIVRQWKPTRVGYVAAGATSAHVGAVIEAFVEADISPDILHPVNMSAYKAACEGFHVANNEHQITHLAGQGPLDDAIAVTPERRVGDGWSWGSGGVSTTSLVAVTIARSLLPEKVEVPTGPVFAY